MPKSNTAPDKAGPTPERLAKAGENFTVGSGQARVVTLTDNPFARAHNRRVISTKQYEAGQKYHIHWYHAGLSDALGSADLNRIFAADVSNFSGMAKTEAQAFHRQRIRLANQVVGKIGTDILTHHICQDMPLVQVGLKLGWKSEKQAVAAATERLRMALDMLCDHWQL